MWRVYFTTVGYLSLLESNTRRATGSSMKTSGAQQRRRECSYFVVLGLGPMVLLSMTLWTPASTAENIAEDMDRLGGSARIARGT